MIRPRKRADGSIAYLVEVKHAGKRYPVGTFDTRAKAEEAEQEFKVERRKIDRGELPEHTDQRRTFGDLVEAWLKHLGGSARVKGHRSRKTYRLTADRYLLPVFRDVPITAITSDMVEGLRNELSETLMVNTVSAAIGCMSSAMAFAMRKKWLAANPCHGLTRIDVQRDHAGYRWLQTRAEIEHLLGNCQDDLRDAVAVAIGTGMRQGELRNLQWIDVDLERRLIAVRRGDQGTTKSGKPRRIPILDAALPVLRQRALRRAGDVLVFPGPKGKVLSKTTLGRGLKAALARSELDTGVRWHDLRHTFASHWVADGGDIFRLSEILGHSDVNLTRKTYAHLRPQAWEQDYARVSFRVPTEPAKVHQLERDAAGRIVGRGLVRSPLTDQTPDAECHPRVARATFQAV